MIMTLEFPKAKFHFIKNGQILTVTELNSRKSIQFLNQPEIDNIDVEFLLLGFVTTFPELDVY